MPCSPPASGMRCRRFNSLLRLLVDVLRHLRLVDGAFELLGLGRGALLLALAQLLLDRAHLLAQQVLAVGLADRLARALADLAAHLERLDALGEAVQQLVEAGLEVEGLEQVLLLLGRDVHHPGDEVGELRAALERLERGDHLLGHLGQQLHHLAGALAECQRAALDLGPELLGLLDQLHARGVERVAVEELRARGSASAPCRWRSGCRRATSRSAARSRSCRPSACRRASARRCRGASAAGCRAGVAGAPLPARPPASARGPPPGAARCRERARRCAPAG